MAEAVGLAASVTGLISLGIQVTQGIVRYIDALESRQDELASVKHRNDALSGALAVITTASTQLPIQHQAATTAVLHSVQSCSNDLGAAHRLLADLTPSDTGTWWKRAQGKKKKLTYFFDRSKIQNLAKRLDSATLALQTALGALGLEISRHNTDKLAAIETFCHDTSEQVRGVRYEVSEVETAVSNIHHQSNTLHRDIAAVGQFVAAQSEASVSQQRKDLEDIKSILQRLRKGNTWNRAPELEFAKLVTKPAALREVCDGVGLQRPSSLDGAPTEEVLAPQPHAPRPEYATGYGCICHGRNITSTVHEGQRWGPVIVSSERSSTGHWPRCPLAAATNTKRRAVHVRYAWPPARLLRAAIGVSFAATSGAGGFSISPGFTYQPTVDERVDPAFRIVRLLGWGRFWELDTDGLFYNACLKRLAKLLLDRKACPAAVNDQNQTLMHRATKAAQQLSIKAPLGTQLVELLQLLLSFKVPTFSYDCSGNSPLVAFQPSSYEPSMWGSSDAWISALSKENKEGQPVALQKSSDSPHGDGTRILTCYNRSPFTPEAYGCGPLSLAVVSSNTREVERLISQFPSMLEELDDHGYSPLHLAANKPDCLKLLVAAASSAQLNRETYGRSSVLDIAMRCSSGRCLQGRSSQKCRRCACAQCVAILLGAGCAVRKADRHFGSLLATASERARRRYVCHVAKRAASRRKLNGTKVEGPSAIYKYLHNDHHVDYELLAGLLYRHGFKLGPDYPYGLARAKPSYICWLVDHGVDLWLREPNGPRAFGASASPGVFGAHHACYAVGNYARSVNSVPDMDRINAISLQHPYTDGCHCHCSAGGCSPFIWMLKGTKPGRTTTLRAQGFYRFLVPFFRRCDPAHTRPFFLAAVRYATFEALGLIHTCCRPYLRLARGAASWAAARHDEAEAHLVNDEQAALLEQHEDLLRDFEGEAAQALRAAAAAGDGAPLADFWRARWLVRVEAALQELDGAALTEAERRGAEAIGVRWCAPSPAAEKPARDPPATLAYWFYELDAICPEYKEPWPGELREEWQAVEEMFPRELEAWNEGREWRRFEEWLLVRN